MATENFLSQLGSYLNPATLGIGILGSLFGTRDEELSDEQRMVYNMLLSRSRTGMDPALLESLRRRATGAVGNEFAGLSAETAARLRRSNAPIAKTEEVMAELGQRRAGAKAEALTGIDALNEQFKMDAMRTLAGYSAGFPTKPAAGFGYGELMTAGIGGIQQQISQEDYYRQLDMILNRGQSNTISPMRMDLLAPITTPPLKTDRGINPNKSLNYRRGF